MPRDDGFPIFTELRLSFAAQMRPDLLEPDAYLNHVTGEAYCLVDDDTEVRMGQISLYCLMDAWAFNSGIRAFDVCDAHSDFLADAYLAVFRKNGELREELQLQIEPSTDNLIILEAFEFEPRYRETMAVVAAFETAISCFQASGVTIACRDKTGGEYQHLELNMDQWKALGFVQIAGTEFAVRDGSRVNPYEFRKRRPKGGR